MRTRRSLEHDAALSRRLAQLGDELSEHRAGVRPARPELPPTELTSAPWWDDHTRVAAPRQSAQPPPRPQAGPGAGPPAQPAARPAAQRPAQQGVPPGRPPGRHALRGSPRFPGPAGLGAAQLAAVSVVVAVGLAVTCWWLVRGSAHPSAELSAAPAAGLVSASPAVHAGDAPVGSAPTAQTAEAAAARPATVTIDVAGKVRHPGIAVLDAGARVIDALNAAGGAKPGVDLTGLNLARVLVDGEQVVVGGAAAASGSPASADPDAAPDGPATLVNLNTASEGELDSLPEVGPVTAASILQWRDQHGGFTSVDELLEIDGIGEVTLGKLTPYVTV